MKYFTQYILIALLGVFFTSECNAQSLIFESGYEGDSHVIQHWKQGTLDSTHADIEGIDNGWDWEISINESPDVGFFAIRYEVLDTLAAKAEIIPEPGNLSNNILSFNLSAPNVSEYAGGLGKGRIQGVFTENNALRSFHLTERLFIHEDFDFFTEPQFDSINLNWMTIQEFWNNNPKIGEPYPFRVTLNILKPINSDTLYFGVHAQTQDTIIVWDNVWDSIATFYPIPLGSWLNIETHFVEGDSLNGKFKFIVTDTTGITQTIFDITGFTYHPLDPNPNGIQSFNPMKLYTFGPYINAMADSNKCLCLYWDDLKLWKDNVVSVPTAKESLQSITVYPNPTSNKVIINLGTFYESIDVKLSNMLGQELYSSTLINKEKIELEINGRSGFYIIEILTPTGEKRTIKVLKE